jgi:hypothetical protein
VLADNPDQISVGDMGSVKVEYRSPEMPTITVRENWKDLPDHGVFLPNGRKLFVEVHLHGDYISPSDNIPEIKAAAARIAVRHYFRSGFVKPELPVPDFTQEGAQMPEVETAQYGEHPLSGEVLVTFGALEYDQWNRSFSWRWHLEKADAEATRARSLQVAQRIQGESKVRREQEAAQALAQRLALEEQQRQEQAAREQERLLASQLKSGEALANFTAWSRRGGVTHNGHGWVIRADGRAREHDSSDAARRRSDGTLTWNIVGADELALRWTCGHTDDIRGNSICEVVKLPVDGCTPAQLQAVRQIEVSELGLKEGAFGLNAEASVKSARLVKELLAAIPTCPATGEQIEWNLDLVTKLEGSDGCTIAEGFEVQKLVDFAKPLTARSNNRDAQVVASYQVSSDTVVDALAYEKFGRWNLSLRARPRVEGDDAIHADENASESQETTGITLEGLFGGNVKIEQGKRKRG